MYHGDGSFHDVSLRSREHKVVLHTICSDSAVTGASVASTLHIDEG